MLNDHPLVSVVIPVYNGEPFIAECLLSVYRQTYRSIEVIIVDDGSTDRSLAIIEQFAGGKKIIRQQNKDVCHARNAGIRAASGDFIAFLDQDDLWQPDKLEKQAAVFQKNPEVDLVFTDLIKFFPSGKRHHAADKDRLARSLTDENLFDTLVRKNVLMPSAVMVRRASIVAAGLFDEQFKTCGDYELWLRMAALGMKFFYLPEALTLYRYHGANTSKKTATMHEDRMRAIKKTFANPLLSEGKKRLERPALAAAQMMGAHTFFSIGEYEKFLENARQALSYDWRQVNARLISRYLRSWLHLKFTRK
jgi:glycosyltransferase involved in cell wall biosynthesis